MPTKRTTSRPAKPLPESWRASWKGELRVGLVRFTVEAVNAHSSTGSDVQFHQLHEACHSRIRYKKTCPIHGEVPQSEIVKGYEYAKGKYVEIDPQELDELRTEDDRALTIDEFIEPSSLDPIYYDGRMYYLVPEDGNDREPYHLIRRALLEAGRVGIGHVVFSGKRQLAAIIARDEILIMAMLNYAAEIRSPQSIGDADPAKVSAQNMKLAKELIHSMESKKFDIARYTDHYREEVKQLIETKKKGKEIVAPPPEPDEAPVINLMDALRRSVAGKKEPRPRGAGPAPKRRRRTG